MSWGNIEFTVSLFTSLVGFWLSLLVHDVPRKDDVGIDLSRILVQFWYAPKMLHEFHAWSVGLVYKFFEL